MSAPVPPEPAAPEPRLVGYGADVPHAGWPGGARIAVNVVINVEEGAEERVGDGFARSEAPLTDQGMGDPALVGRDLAAESLMAYGARVGFWRLHRYFVGLGLPVTVSACALALERNPAVAAAVRAAVAGHGWDVLAHGYRFSRHYLLDPDEEAAEITLARRRLEALVGRSPQGYYCRYGPSEHTRRLVHAAGYGYDSNAYDDELPYWTDVDGAAHLVVPHTFSCNDNKYARGWWATSADFERYCCDSFDVLYAEGAERPRMLVISLHPRLSGHPGRFAGVQRVVAHITAHDGVWFTGRDALADHWRTRHPPPREENR
ncbi:MAG: chitin deacetylase [Acidimicrobiia bacterium]